MSLHQEFNKATDCGIGIAYEPEGLSLIHDPSCAAAIWRRKPLKSFQDWLDAQIPENLPSARLILRPDTIRSALSNIVATAGLPDCAERSLLVQDISALGHIFSGIMHAPYLKLRLQAVSTNACRKFHIDNIKARLICTYRGRGTQYGRSENSTEPREVKNVSTGSVMIMRGTLWPESPNSGLLHRSPPIEGTDETRLVLVLDPIEDLDGELAENVLH